MIVMIVCEWCASVVCGSESREARARVRMREPCECAGMKRMCESAGARASGWSSVVESVVCSVV